MATPKTPGRETTAEERTESLRAALARREAAKTFPGTPPPANNGKGSDADAARALDTFEATVVPAAAVALAERDFGDDGVGGDAFRGEQELGQDEQGMAGEAGDLLNDDQRASNRERLDEEDDDEEEDASLFGAGRLGRGALEDLAAGVIPDAAAGAEGPRAVHDSSDRENPFGSDEQESSGSNLLSGVGSVQDMLDGRRAGIMEEVSIMGGFLDDAANTKTSKYSVAAGNDPTQVDQDAITEDQAVNEMTDIVEGRNNDGLTEPDGPPEDMTDEVVEAVGGFLGGLTPAGKVAGAFMKGWNLGREIDEATGAGETAGNFYGEVAAKVNEAVGITDEAAYAKEQEAKAAEAQAKRQAAEAKKAEEEAAKKAEEEAAKKAAAEAAKKEEEAKKDGGGTKQEGDPDDPDGYRSGPPTQAEMAFRRHLYDATGYKGAGSGDRGGEVDPAEESATTSGVRIAPTGIKAQGKDGLIGQPADEPTFGGGGQAGGNLPGDQGNIDFGEANDTGQFTSTQRGGDPADLGGNVGAAPLKRRGEDSEEDDASKGGYVSVVKSAVKADDTREVVAASRRGFGDDDDDN